VGKKRLQQQRTGSSEPVCTRGTGGVHFVVLLHSIGRIPCMSPVLKREAAGAGRTGEKPKQHGVREQSRTNRVDGRAATGQALLTLLE
jgi:hypothetical protein